MNKYENKNRRYRKNEKQVNYLQILICLIVVIASVICIFTGIKGIIEEYKKIYISNSSINIWIDLSEIYIGIALGTFIPILYIIFNRDMKLSSYMSEEIKETSFSKENRDRIYICNETMVGTLKFWKKQVLIYKRLHYYSLIWSTLIAVVLPILIQAIEGYGKILLTIISTHSAIIVAFHKGFKIENNYRSYRMNESNFYDVYRNILTYNIKPTDEEDKVVDEYIKNVNSIRKFSRQIEIDNIPSFSNKEKSKES